MSADFGKAKLFFVRLKIGDTLANVFSNKMNEVERVFFTVHIGSTQRLSQSARQSRKKWTFAEVESRSPTNCK